MVGVLSFACLSASCEGKIRFQDANYEGEETHDPGPIQDRMPTQDDCEGGERVFANDAPARLLTRYEFDNSVRDLLGVDLGLAREHLPPENSTGGFENNVSSHVVNTLLVRKYLEIADEIAIAAVAQNNYGDGFVPDLLYRAFRRPPTSDEVKAFEALHAASAEQWGATRAREMTISAILQSPQFLYRLEFADGRAPNQIVQNSPYEMASRLSFMMWSTIPDQALLDAASRDELRTKAQIEAQVRRMLEDPRAKDTVAHFYRQWLHLDALSDSVKDEATFPEMPGELSQDWRASIDAWIDYVHHDGGGTLDALLTSDSVFVTPDLATMYEMGSVDAMERVSMADSRAGLLTQPALLALLAYPEQGSPIHRGIFVREQLLCQKLAPPPDDVPIEPPDPDPNATTRERFAQHTEVDGCANCHRLIDPIGFGFEEYDALGRYRTEEAGQPIDASGELLGSGDKELDGPFVGAMELTRRLAESDVVAHCVADQWTTFALGQPPTNADLCSKDGIREAFAQSRSFEDLFVAIATSDAMRYRVIQEAE